MFYTVPLGNWGNNFFIDSFTRSLASRGTTGSATNCVSKVCKWGITVLESSFICGVIEWPHFVVVFSGVKNEKNVSRSEIVLQFCLLLFLCKEIKILGWVWLRDRWPRL